MRTYANKTTTTTKPAKPAQADQGWRMMTKEQKQEYNREYYAKNKDKMRMASKEWHAKNKDKSNKSSKEWHAKNKDKVSEKAREYYTKNKDKINKSHREWCAKNKDRVCEYVKQYYIKNPKQSIRHRISVRIASCIKKSTRSYNLEWSLGYTIPELVDHLEKQFVDGMGWDNRPEWHIDHIKPLSSFNYSSCDDPDFKQCWALSNLQPLWAEDNWAKGSKAEHPV